MESNFIERATIAALLLLALGLRVANLDNVYARTPDERFYTRDANVWQQSGVSGVRALVEQYKRDPETWNFPPPTRVGMIALLAATMRLTGQNDESAGALISCIASAGSALVLALIGLRFFPRWTTAIALLFYAVSPAELVIARRTWSDALLELIGISMVFAACEITRDSRRLRWYLLLTMLGAAGVAVKEAMLVPYGLIALWLLWVLAIRRREWRNVAILCGAAVGGMAVSVGWLAYCVGSLSDLVNIISAIPAANAINTYAVEYASGPPWQLLQALWIVSPAAALLSVIGVYAAFALSDVSRWIALYTLVHICIAMVMPHWLNLRYVAVVFGLFYLMAGLGGWRLMSWCGRWLQGIGRKVSIAVAVAALVAAAATDYSRFERIFVVDATADLSIKMLLDEQHR